MKDETESFLEKKEDILNNITILRFNLETSIDAGFFEDTGSNMYNRIEEIIEQVKNVDTKEELEELVTQAKTIEAQIDTWLLSQGQTTVGLSWPTF